MPLKRYFILYIYVWIFVFPGCAIETPTRNINSNIEEDPFERDEPSAECFENEEAIKKAYLRLSKVEGSILSAIFLPSFSFVSLKNNETGARKIIFVENHNIPAPFDKNGWLIIEETPAKIETIIACVVMLNFQKF